MHKISALTSTDPDEWVEYLYCDDELNEMLAYLRDLEARNIPYEHTVDADAYGPASFYGSTPGACKS